MTTNLNVAFGARLDARHTLLQLSYRRFAAHDAAGLLVLIVPYRVANDFGRVMNATGIVYAHESVVAFGNFNVFQSGSCERAAARVREEFECSWKRTLSSFTRLRQGVCY